MQVKLDSGARMPERAHKWDAGLDVFSRENKTVPGKESAIFDTGVHIEIPVGYVGLLLSKSGLNMKKCITSEGVIDAGYTGSIRVKLYNHSEKPYSVYAGDKISQLVIVPVLYSDLELVRELRPTERGDSGFGSTGR